MIQLKYDPTEMAQLKQLIQSESKGETFEEIALKKVIIGNRAMEKLPSIIKKNSPVETKSVLIVTDEIPIKRKTAVLKDEITDIFQKKGIQAEVLTLRAIPTFYMQICTPSKKFRRTSSVGWALSGLVAEPSPTFANMRPTDPKMRRRIWVKYP